MLEFLKRHFRHTIVAGTCHEKYGPLLTRIKLWKTRWFSVYLHCFHRSDRDRALHDHPWSFFSVILWRGYWEETFAPGSDIETSRARKFPGMILWRRAEWKHRVILPDDVQLVCDAMGTHVLYAPSPVQPKPCYTLVIRFPVRRGWGFWEAGQFTPIEEWQDEC